MIEVTDWARDILTRSQTAAKRFEPSTVIRLVRTAQGVEARLAEGPEGTDVEVPIGDGVTVYAEAGVDGLVDVEEPHDRIVLRPAGSTPNPRGHHGDSDVVG